jgi:hypothetical protein
MTLRIPALSLLLLACRLFAQDDSGNAIDANAPGRWNLYQATSIGQYYGTFYAPYDGPLSLPSRLLARLRAE